MTRAKPMKLSPTDLAERQRFAERKQQLEQIIAQASHELGKNEGAWDYWREHVIWPRYRLGDEDKILEDGSFERA